ncbi:hypothetical protein BDV93DRAFT_609782 [Ceratobasidium sp. AG-I]|nr:hypothetical protein BDV93DRAFT_609782 [Ceratobasidium sp. AG-I]
MSPPSNMGFVPIPTPPTSIVIPKRKYYDLELIVPSASGASYLIKAKPSASSTYRFLDSDAQFDISSKLGSANGQFVWGGTGFDKNGSDFKFTQDERGRFILEGSLKQNDGTFRHASIDLDKWLKVIEYVDQASWETTYKLVERNRTPAPRRTLVLCFDGTSNHFSKKNTNVVKFVELLKKNNPERQMVYYQTGVGTYSPPGMLTDLGLKIAEKADEAAAWYLYQHVIDGYKFLMESYRNGDVISIFGFSRGAFTARALAGMLHCVGLLPRHNAEHIPFAYEIYKNADDYYNKPQAASWNTESHQGTDEDQIPLATDPTVETRTTGSRPQDVNPEDFKKTFCIPVTIGFVGVWDTVASVGALFPRTLPWIGYNPSITVFRQALALDEHRSNFVPSVWDHRYNHQFQSALEVWFRGEHTDIGGGSDAPHDPNVSNEQKHTLLNTLGWAAHKCVEMLGFRSESAKPNETDHSMLSNISLRWMIRQCMQSNIGIVFDHTAMETYRNNGVLERSMGDYMSTGYWERMKASATLDEADMKRYIYDSIGWSVLWNSLEVMPVAKPTSKHVSEPNSSDQVLKPEYTRRPNLKKGRSVYTRGSAVQLHSSVVEYMTSDSGKGYRPRASWHSQDGRLEAADSPKNVIVRNEVREKLGLPKLEWEDNSGIGQSGFMYVGPKPAPEANQP